MGLQSLSEGANRLRISDVPRESVPQPWSSDREGHIAIIAPWNRPRMQQLSGVRSECLLMQVEFKLIE